VSYLPRRLGRQVVRNGLTEYNNRKFKRQIINEPKTLRLCNIDSPDLYEQFTIEEVIVAPNQLKLGKSPGPVGIYNEYLANLVKNIVNWLTLFINTCFHNNRIAKM